MNPIENWQGRYRSNTWMGRTCTDGPDEFEPSKFDCRWIDRLNMAKSSDLEVKNQIKQNQPEMLIW